MEKKDCLQLLDQNTREILELVKTCSTHQLRFKQEGQWNILEILEHIIIVDKICAALLLKPSNQTAEKISLYGKEKLSKIMIEGRGRKVKAPDLLQPKGEIKDIVSFEKLFLAERNLLKENVEKDKIIINNSIHKHPMLAEMTISDWLYFIPLHAERHLEQIKDLIEVSNKN